MHSISPTSLFAFSLSHPPPHRPHLSLILLPSRLLSSRFSIDWFAYPALTRIFYDFFGLHFDLVPHFLSHSIQRQVKRERERERKRERKNEREWVRERKKERESLCVSLDQSFSPRCRSQHEMGMRMQMKFCVSFPLSLTHSLHTTHHRSCFLLKKKVCCFNRERFTPHLLHTRIQMVVRFQFLSHFLTALVGSLSVFRFFTLLFSQLHEPQECCQKLHESVRTWGKLSWGWKILVSHELEEFMWVKGKKARTTGWDKRRGC